ncbi:hypothetical protein MRB53_022185 [Persea americana]|uniref:Uncharacterized protein n=1 Tax=Persea americana TaxID=3435 RepID=A0ACC2L6Z1_PERAE|nr:hypothetical protein MRB53_022185 [Persea americana]
MATIASSSSSSCIKTTIPSAGRRFKYSGEYYVVIIFNHYVLHGERALPIPILKIGKKRFKGIQLIVEECKEKLKYYCSVDDVQIKSNPKNTSDVMAQIKGEDSIIIQYIRSEDWVVVLDERGLYIGSEQMAELVGDARKTVDHQQLHFALAALMCFWSSFTEHGPFSKDRSTITSVTSQKMPVAVSMCTGDGAAEAMLVEWGEAAISAPLAIEELHVLLLCEELNLESTQQSVSDFSSTALLASKDGDKKGSTASSFGNARSGSGYGFVYCGCGHGKGG